MKLSGHNWIGPQADKDCAESLRLSCKRLNPKSLILNLRSGRAEPSQQAAEPRFFHTFRALGGRALSRRRYPSPAGPPPLGLRPQGGRERGRGEGGVPLNPRLAPWAMLCRSFGASFNF